VLRRPPERRDLATEKHIQGSQKWADAPRKSAFLMHPAFFIPAFTLLGLLFATQELINAHHMSYDFSLADIYEAWGLQYFLWGVIWWLLLRQFRSFIEQASLSQMFAIVLPSSLVICLLQEMVYVILFPKVPKHTTPVPYWQRVELNYVGDLVESMAVFWGGFFFFRGVAYYHRLREKETVAAQLEVQLANARIEALRMQLNPHFLFNTMNSISSLMRIDIEAADSLLEQLSSLLRMTLERRDVQLIPLHDEIEFTETYLAMQDRRYAGRATRTLSVDPELHDALVPAMILQPIVENAYTHGLSKLDRGGQLSIEVKKDGQYVKALITNSGLGLNGFGEDQSNGYGVGLTNVRNRLRLHYGDACAFSIRELDRTHVQVSLAIPLQLSTGSPESVTRYGD
jgi:two-component system, LytTR family, sensor kinase